MTGFWDAVASAGPYANNRNLAANRQPQQHFISRFLQAGDAQPTVSSTEGNCRYMEEKNKKTWQSATVDDKSQ